MADTAQEGPFRALVRGFLKTAAGQAHLFVPGTHILAIRKIFPPGPPVGYGKTFLSRSGRPRGTSAVCCG